MITYSSPNDFSKYLAKANENEKKPFLKKKFFLYDIFEKSNDAVLERVVIYNV